MMDYSGAGCNCGLCRQVENKLADRLAIERYFDEEEKRK